MNLHENGEIIKKAMTTTHGAYTCDPTTVEDCDWRVTKPRTV